VTLFLHGLGHFFPENQITNKFLEELDIGTDDQWIMERVGIRSRRTVLSLDYIRTTKNKDTRAGMDAVEIGSYEMGAEASRMAIDRAGISASDIGMVISGSSGADYQAPADACMVANELDIDVRSFDVNSACTSFLAQLYLLDMMQPEKLPPYVLVLGTESLTKTVDYTDRSTAVLWGDASAAAVISTREPAPARILGCTFDSRSTACDKVIVRRAGHFGQDGRTVQIFAIKTTSMLYEKLREEFETPERIFHFVGHQANLRMLESVCRRSDIRDDRHHYNVDWYGNTGAASSASVISMDWEKWNSGDDVAVAGVGAGLSWSSYLLRFEDRSENPS